MRTRALFGWHLAVSAPPPDTFGVSSLRVPIRGKGADGGQSPDFLRLFLDIPRFPWLSGFRDAQKAGIVFRDQVIKGTVQLTIMALLERRPMYGYEIIQHVNAETDGQFQWREASLYPALYRLEEQKMVAGEWRLGSGKRRRKYYSLSKEGRKALAHQRREWLRISSLVTQLVCER